MKFSGLFEKIEVLINLIINSNVFIIFILLVLGMILLKFTKKISNKKLSVIIYIFEILTLGFVIYEEKEFLVKVFDKLVDNIFLNFYFPSIYIYSFIFIVSFIIFIYTLLNRFISKTYKMITNTYFLIYNFTFILFLNVISKNNIDVFEKTSLFTNNDSLILLELSTLLFFIYIVTISLVYFTNSIILFVEEKKISSSYVKTTEKYDNELGIVNLDVVEERLDDKLDYIPKPAVSFQELVKSIGNINEHEEKINLVPEIDLTENNEKFKFIDPVLIEEPFANDVINTNDMELINEKLNFIDFNILENSNDDKLTLNDYKMFSNMLKTVIRNNNNSNLSLEDILDKKLLSKYSFEEYSKFEKILNSCLN